MPEKGSRRVYLSQYQNKARQSYGPPLREICIPGMAQWKNKMVLMNIYIAKGRGWG